jgi:hypothetical protein
MLVAAAILGCLILTAAPSPGPLGPTALLILIQETYKGTGILFIEIARVKNLSPNGTLGTQGSFLGNPDLTIHEIQKRSVLVRYSWIRLAFLPGLEIYLSGGLANKKYSIN